MSEQILNLPALREDNPRDFLAALGLLRLLETSDKIQAARMKWSPDGIPILQFTADSSVVWSEEVTNIARELLLDVSQNQTDLKPLQEWLEIEFQSPSQKFVREGTRINRLIYGAVASINRDYVRVAFDAGLGFDDPKKRDIIGRLHAALCSQTQFRKDKNKIAKSEASHLSLANKQGQKYLLYGVQQIVKSEFEFRNLQKEIPSKSRGQTFRWSPDEFRPSAYLGGVPEYESVAEANLAAFFGMSFYPVCDAMTSFETAGFFTSQKGARFFTWPTWHEPISSDAIMSMLHIPEIHIQSPNRKHMNSVGINRVWRSRRFTTDDNNVHLLPAKLM